MDKIETLAEIAAHSTASISMSPDLMVTFNVGGHTFLVSKETLSRHTGQFTSTYLTALSDPYWNSSTIVPIDRNPVLFEAVLEFLRYDRWRIPKGVPASDVFDELEFYGYVVPRCTVTAAWHRTKKNQEKIILKLQTLEPSVLKQVQDLVAQVLENDSDQLFVAPSADYLERQLAHLGLPSLKVKIADLLRTTLEGALVHNQLFELLRSAEGPQLVTYIAHRQFFESVVEVEQWRLNLEVVTRPGSVANDYRLAATAPSGSDLNRGTGASVLLVRAKPADRNYANQ